MRIHIADAQLQDSENRQSEAVLARRRSGLAEKVAGVFTYGAPKIGDAEFCSTVGTMYAGRLYRYVHGSDMVTKLPAGFGYVDHSLERFLVSRPTAAKSRCGTRLQRIMDRFLVRIFCFICPFFPPLFLFLFWQVLVLQNVRIKDRTQAACGDRQPAHMGGSQGFILVRVQL